MNQIVFKLRLAIKNEIRILNEKHSCMKLLIDMQGAQSHDSKGRGVGRYTRELVKAVISKRGKIDDIFLACNGAFLDEYEVILKNLTNHLPQDNVRCWQQYINPVSGQYGDECKRKIAELSREWYIQSKQADIVWSTNFLEGWADEAVTSASQVPSRSKLCVTLHDVIPLQYPNEHLFGTIKEWYNQKIEHIKKADIVFTDSEHSKSKIIELIEYDSDKIIVAPCAVDKVLFSPSLNSKDEISELGARLGLHSGDYFLYVGGFDAHKNTALLIEGLAKAINKGVKKKLVLAGRQADSFKSHLQNLLDKHNVAANIVISTGEVSDHDLVWLYRHCCAFLFPSYAEGFGIPPLEAMSCGAPVLAANASSIPEVIGNPSALFDPYDPEDLAHKICNVVFDTDYANSLRTLGLKRADEFSWEKSADKIISSVELLDYNRAHKKTINYNVIDQIVSIQSEYLDDLTKNDLIDIAKTLTENAESHDNRTLYIDISTFVHSDHGTGIQRVVRSIINNLPASTNIFNTIKLAYSFTGDMSYYEVRYDSLGHINRTNNRSIVQFHSGDCLLHLDLHPGSAISKDREIIRLISMGVHVFFVVYDLLPIDYPHYFVPELSYEFGKWLNVVAKSTGALCISRDVMNRYNKWKQDHKTGMPYNKSYTFTLGAEIVKQEKLTLDNDDIKVLKKIPEGLSFLMVGTLEPRKGHGFVIDAFEELWNKGHDVSLIIAGRPGWLNDKVINRIKNHILLGKYIFWLEGISDEVLEHVYKRSTCLIAASEGEGFGLPIIEAAQYKIPILARDIPVFREVAGNHATYFHGDHPSSLATAVLEWINSYSSKTHINSSDLPFINWKQSTSQLFSTIDSVVSNERNWNNKTD